jgi:hypothetical protein
MVNGALTAPLHKRTMRFAGKCLGLAALAVLLGGAGADAPVHVSRLTVPPRRAAATSGLRGPQTAGASRARVLASVPHPTLAESVTTAAAPADPGQCRLACAQPYYFCLAGPDAGSCSQEWTHCLVGCDQPASEP